MTPQDRANEVVKKLLSDNLHVAMLISDEELASPIAMAIAQAEMDAVNSTRQPPDHNPDVTKKVELPAPPTPEELGRQIVHKIESGFSKSLPHHFEDSVVADIAAVIRKVDAAAYENGTLHGIDEEQKRCLDWCDSIGRCCGCADDIKYAIEYDEISPDRQALPPTVPPASPAELDAEGEPPTVQESLTVDQEQIDKALQALVMVAGELVKTTAEAEREKQGRMIADELTSTERAFAQAHSKNTRDVLGDRIALLRRLLNQVYGEASPATKHTASDHGEDK